MTETLTPTKEDFTSGTFENLDEVELSQTTEELSKVENSEISPELIQKAKDIVNKINNELRKPKSERDEDLLYGENVELMEVISGNAEQHNENSFRVNPYTLLKQRNTSEREFVRCAESNGKLKIYIKPKENIRNQEILPELTQKAKNIVNKINNELRKPKSERDEDLLYGENVELMEVISGNAEQHNETSFRVNPYTLLKQRNTSEREFVRCTESNGKIKIYIKPH